MPFLVKEEPTNYSFDAFVSDGGTVWEGVRNPAAQKHLRSIKKGDLVTAIEVAMDQVRGGANFLDVNMDEGMLDSAAEMTRLLNWIATEPEIARIPTPCSVECVPVRTSPSSRTQDSCLVD